MSPEVAEGVTVAVTVRGAPFRRPTGADFRHRAGVTVGARTGTAG